MFDSGEDGWIAGGGGVGVEDLGGDGDASFWWLMDWAASLDGGEDGVAALLVDVADVEREADAGGDGVGGAGEDVAEAYGGYGVWSAGGEGCPFYGQG